jgi:excisionase family DNA binding protein
LHPAIDEKSERELSSPPIVEIVTDVEGVTDDAGVKSRHQLGEHGRWWRAKGSVRVMARKTPYVGDRLLTVVEVAALMRVSNMTVYRLIKSGNLAAIRVGKNYRIRESDVDLYLSDRAVRVTNI